MRCKRVMRVVVRKVFSLLRALNRDLNWGEGKAESHVDT